MNLKELSEWLSSNLSSRSGQRERVELVARTMSRLFSVRADEIGIFFYDRRERNLRFLWPQKLQSAGSIPLSSSVSLVSRTAREKRGYIRNSFADAIHTTFFEHIPLEEEEGDPGKRRIQKIMSVPMLHKEELRGVIQVSRKGLTREVAGGDFTDRELAILERLAGVAAPFLEETDGPGDDPY